MLLNYLFVILKLGNISTIQTGFFATPDAIGDYVCLQTRDFDENGNLTSLIFPNIRGEKVSDKHRLKSGDILFAAKGVKNFATVIGENYPPCVASTSFFVLRLKVNNIIPKYLAWYLNLSSTQGFLKSNAIGTSIASISKVVLEDVNIIVPTIETQQNIVQIFDLKFKERLLNKKIETLKEQLIEQIILKKINKEDE